MKEFLLYAEWLHLLLRLLVSGPEEGLHPAPGRVQLRNPIFFLLRTAFEDRPLPNRQLPTTNPHQPPIANHQPSPTATNPAVNRQPPIATNHS